MELDSYAQLVKDVTTRVIDDGDLSVLDQFFDVDTLNKMPTCAAYAIVKLVIRSGYDISYLVFTKCSNLFPHMMVPFYHSGLAPADFLSARPYSGPIILVKEGFHISDDSSAKFVKASLGLCARNVGDVFDDTDFFCKFAVVEYSFDATMLIERGLG